MCSNRGDAIDRIAAAIDQLASDMRETTDDEGAELLKARVADLWQMVSELDPDVARRAQRYTGPADGGPAE
jgi:hypothetical protein